MPVSVRRRRLAAVVTACALALAACGGSDDAALSDDTVAPSSTAATDPTSDAETTTAGGSDVTASGTRVVEHHYGTSEIPVAPQRVIALGEEFLLADLLALGVVPIASTSNDADGFPGLEDADTTGIEIVFTPTLSLEALAALDPDLLLTYPSSAAESVGIDLLDSLAPLVAAGEPDDDWRQRLVATADVLGLDAELASTIEAIDAEIEAGRRVLEGRTVSFLAVMPGPFLRTYTGPEHRLMGPIIDIGVELRPGDDTGADAAGRVVVGLEALGQLDAETLVLFQTAGRLEGEVDAEATVEASPVWPALPAVAADRVVRLDRLGYPGAAGIGRFVTDLAAALDG